MMESGIAQAAGFPPSVQNYELVVEVARHYQPNNRLVVLENMVLTDFTPEAIGDAFNIPFLDNPIETTIDEAQVAYDMNPAKCRTLINEEWYKERRPPSIRIGKKTPRSDFHNEHGDMVTLLSWVMGLPQSNFFEEWMFYFTEQVFAGKSKFDWAQIISDNIHTQLVKLKEKRHFTMTSYLVYMFARHQPLPRLIKKGEIENRPNQVKVYDYYPQLHYHDIAQREKNKPAYAIGQYERINDAFTMRLVKLMQGGLHIRLSEQATILVQRYGAWFIQFPRFSYIRIAGFEGAPFRLPSYPTDKVILLEVARQAPPVNSLLRDKKQSGFAFPMILGNLDVHLKNPAHADESLAELASYCLQEHFPRKCLDHDNLAKRAYGRCYRPKESIEDYWKNCSDGYEVRRRENSRLSVQQMRLYEYRRVLDQVIDSRNCLQV